MRLRCLAIAVFILASMAAVCGAQQMNDSRPANYSGAAKLVLKLAEMPEMPPMPENQARTGGLVPTTFGFPAIVQNGSTSAFNAPQAPEAPPVQQGTLLQATVLYSDDPSIKVNGSYSLLLGYDPQAMPYGLQDKLLDAMVPGAVVGVNDYTLEGDQIKVDVGTTYWKRKISVLDAPGVEPGEKNPFRIDLSFKQFPGFEPFPSQDYAPSPILAWHMRDIGAPALPGKSWNSGFFDIVGRFLG